MTTHYDDLPAGRQPDRETPGAKAARPGRVRITGDLFHPEVPPGAVNVTRQSRWGNPHPIGKSCRRCGGAVHNREQAQTVYRQHLAEHPELVDEARRDLVGRDLACWCRPDQPCHADILLEVVNDEN
jgi:hypothetical protein